MARIIHIVMSAATIFAITLFVIATLKNDLVEEEGQTKRFHLLGGNHHQRDDSNKGSTVPVNETNKSLDETTTNQPIKEETKGMNVSSQKVIESSSMSNNTELQQQQQQQQQNSQQKAEFDVDSSSTNNADEFTLHEITAMRKKLAPREILRNDNGEPLVHQFLHLHHMKTGGTSMDGLIRCGLLRFKRMHNNAESGIIPYSQIHECGPQRYKDCKSGKSVSCLTAIQEASVMSYCAPLKDLEIFGWTNNNENYNSNDAENNPGNNSNNNNDNDADDVLLNSIGAITVIRHPVERVWSMYRFQTKMCYQCRSLQEVYNDIDNGVGFDSDVGQGCANQLNNHLTRNLLLGDDSRTNNNNNNNTATTKASDPEQQQQQQVIIQQAIANLNSFFTLVGLTEELDTMACMVGMVFPWLNKTINGSETECPLPRSNVSPENNHCGPDGKSHMPLPDYPDEATVQLIQQHNQLDFYIYQAAVKRFKLQKEALGIA